jgi:L-threonylcarbamoyladenylate synthase
METLIQKAVRIVRHNGVIIFPTDTVYGIGAALSSQGGIRRLYQIKMRPLNQPTALLCLPQCTFIEQVCSDKSQRNEYQTLINHFWPGPLTIIFPLDSGLTKSGLLRIVSAGRGSIGVRCPDHPLVLELLEALAEPLVATSANRSGEAAPMKLGEVDEDIQHEADLIIPGAVASGIASTVLDTTHTPWRILREGEISKDDIRTIIQRVEMV